MAERRLGAETIYYVQKSYQSGFEVKRYLGGATYPKCRIAKNL